MSLFKYNKDDSGIVTITMDMTDLVNTMNVLFNVTLRETVERLEQEQSIIGVIICFTNNNIIAEDDLTKFLTAVEETGTEQQWFDTVESMKNNLRRLEKLPVPVVATINGAALGGRFEICLSCNYRIAWNDASVQIGLPEVSLGLLSGAGGVVRLTHLLGLQIALPYLLEGRKITPVQAVDAGLVDETVDQLENLLPRAKDWILQQTDKQLGAKQPWDRKAYTIPGENINSPAMAAFLVMAPALLRKETRGLLPAPEKILNVAVETARLDFDTALRIESRAFVSLLSARIIPQKLIYRRKK